MGQDKGHNAEPGPGGSSEKGRAVKSRRRLSQGCSVPVLKLLILLAWSSRGWTTSDSQDCVSYKVEEGSHHTKIFYHQVSIGITPISDSNQAAVHIQLTSTVTNRTCDFHIVSTTVVFSCRGEAIRQYTWPAELFQNDDTTELYLLVGREGAEEEEEGTAPPGTDLLVVGRRGRHRARVLLSSTFLLPPVRLSFTYLDGHYYYNCVRGCLFSGAVESESGQHSVFLRHDQGFSNLTLSYNASRGLKTVNVTADDLGPPARLSNLTGVWDPQAGTLAVLVDGKPLGELRQYKHLQSDRRVRAEVGPGGGLVASCTTHFQLYQDPATTTTTTQATTTVTTTTPLTTTAAYTTASPYIDHHDGYSTRESMLVAWAFVSCLIIVAMLLYYLCKHSNTCSGMLQRMPQPNTVRTQDKSNPEDGGARQNSIRNHDVCDGAETAGSSSAQEQEKDPLAGSKSSQIQSESPSAGKKSSTAHNGSPLAGIRGSKKLNESSPPSIRGRVSSLNEGILKNKGLSRSKGSTRSERGMKALESFRSKGHARLKGEGSVKRREEAGDLDSLSSSPRILTSDDLIHMDLV